MFQIFRSFNKFYLIVSLVVFLGLEVRCLELVQGENSENESFVADTIKKEGIKGFKELSKALTDMIFTGRKKGGGGGGGMSMFLMRSLMDMFNAYVPMMAMTVMGWMKDVMMLGAGAFMMMMYDQLSKKGQEKKIIIKLSQPPPEPAPPAQTGYGPWEGK